MNENKLTKIEATLTFADGKTCQVLLGRDTDSAWGNVESVLWRSVPVREAITQALFEEELLAEEEEEEEEDS